MNRTRLLGVCVTSAALAGVAVPTGASAAPVITMSGSTSVAPLAALLAKSYVKTHPGKAKFKLAQGGSDIGVADVASGRVTIGNSSRDPKPTDPGGIFFNKIAKDAICLITNKRNNVGNLSQAQIQGIFSGKVNSWSDIAGSGVSGPINLVARTAASGTQDAFQKIFLGSASQSSSASLKASNGLVQQAVASDPNAIGYVSLDFINNVSPAAYQGVACNLRNAKSGEYGGVRNFWMVTRGRAKGATQAFISWIQNASAAQKIVGTHWVPLK